MFSALLNFLKTHLQKTQSTQLGSITVSKPDDILITAATAPAKHVPVVHFDFGHKVGELAKKYETNNKGPGFISNGSKWSDPGGDSYGSYQLETKKGTMQGYLRTVKDRFTLELNKLEINSPAFKKKWRELAVEDPEGFEESQFNYLANKPGGHYDAMAYARKLRWDTDNLAMQSAIFSTSNQSGKWKTGIFDKANINPVDDLRTQINKLYDARAAYFKRLILTKAVKDSIIKNRTVDERRDCLKLIK